MTFYSIVSQDQMMLHGVDMSLQKACEKKGIRYERIISGQVVLDDLAHQKFDPDSLLYRISLDAKASVIEPMLATLRSDIFTTIHYPRTITHPQKNFRELFAQFRVGMNIIPTTIIDETWTTMSSDELTKRIDKLGGFPVVVKTLGLSHGQGVSKLDNAEELRERLVSTDFSSYNTIARKYLADYRHFRLIIIDNEVAACIEYHKPEDDFRTNAVKEPTVTAVDHSQLDPRVVKLALEGVTLRGSILGGVDILVDQSTDTPYLAEVNIPCYYARAEGPTGIDISSKLIDALIKKQKESRS